MQLVFLLGIWHWKKNYCKQINENPHWMKVSVSDSFAPYQSCNTDHDSWWRHYYVSPMLQQRWYTFHVFFIDWNFNLTEVLKSQGRDYHNGFQKKLLLYDSSFIRSYKPFLDQNFLSEYISKPINQHWTTCCNFG